MSSNGKLWTAPVEKNEIESTAVLDKKILSANNPYSHLDLTNVIPESTELLAASSLLQLRPDLAPSPQALDIAVREFGFFLAQTYYFEAVGIQLMSSIAVHADSMSLLHHVGAQLIDETRHAQVYAALYRAIPEAVPFSPSIPPLYRSILNAYTLEEQLVKVFVVLESIAVGIFSARRRAFSKSNIALIDNTVLKEEAEHQGVGLRFIANAIKSGKITFEQIKDIVRTQSQELTHTILPLPVAEEFEILLNPTDLDQLRKLGITGQQIPVTASRIRFALTQLGRRTENYLQPIAEVS